MSIRKLLIAIAPFVMVAVVYAQPTTPAQSSPGSTNPPAVAPTPGAPDGGMPAYIRPETPQQRAARLGTAEDPGVDPDPNKHYWRFGHSYHITRYERRWAAYDQPDPAFVRPLALANFAMEIYAQNEKWLWVWAQDPEPEDVTHAAAEAPPTSRFKADHIAFFERIRPQFSALTPPSSGKTIVFENSSSGLPTNGSWRSSLAVADMNGDGFPDIILPPQRKGNGIPLIFLGDGKGHWHNWENIKWPHTVDYGSVAAADFNKDGHMDLVFGVHLNGVYVFMGDGKGTFTEVSKGLPRDFPTRRVVAVDVDGDGYPDIVTSSEGPTALERAENADYGKIRVYLNRKNGTEWVGSNVSEPSVRIGGDWLSAGNFNGDRIPDFVSSSVYQGSMEVVHLSDKPGHWKPLPSDGDLLPSISYYLASTTGKFSSKKLDDAIISFIRFWPSDLDGRIVPTPPITEMTSIDRISFSKAGAKRTPIVRWSSRAGIWGLASGDFDGDGNLDIIYARDDPREVVILMGDGQGNFRSAVVEGLKLEPNHSYDIKVADVNGDGRPDLVIMYEMTATTTLAERDGSVQVFLNRGVKPGAGSSSRAK